MLIDGLKIPVYLKKFVPSSLCQIPVYIPLGIIDRSCRAIFIHSNPQPCRDNWRVFEGKFLENRRPHNITTILVINEPNAKSLVLNKFIICLYMFRAWCSHHQEVKIVLYSIWYHKPVGGSPVHWTATYRCDDNRCCIIKCWPSGDENIVLETCRGL